MRFHVNQKMSLIISNAGAGKSPRYNIFLEFKDDDQFLYHGDNTEQFEKLLLKTCIAYVHNRTRLFSMLWAAEYFEIAKHIWKLYKADIHLEPHNNNSSFYCCIRNGVDEDYDFLVGTCGIVPTTHDLLDECVRKNKPYVFKRLLEMGILFSSSLLKLIGHTNSIEFLRILMQHRELSQQNKNMIVKAAFKNHAYPEVYRHLLFTGYKAPPTYVSQTVTEIVK